MHVVKNLKGGDQITPLYSEVGFEMVYVAKNGCIVFVEAVGNTPGTLNYWYIASGERLYQVYNPKTKKRYCFQWDESGDAGQCTTCLELRRFPSSRTGPYENAAREALEEEWRLSTTEQ